MSCLKQLSLTTRINNKGGSSSRLDSQLLGRCPHQSIFVCVRLWWRWCKVVIFVVFCAKVPLIRHMCMRTFFSLPSPVPFVLL